MRKVSKDEFQAYMSSFGWVTHSDIWNKSGSLVIRRWYKDGKFIASVWNWCKYWTT